MYKKILFSFIVISAIFSYQKVLSSHHTQSLFEAMESFEKGDYQEAARRFAPYAGHPCPVAELYCLNLLERGCLRTFQIVSSNEENEEKCNLRQWYEAPQKLKALLELENKNFEREIRALMSSSNGPLLYLLGKIYETGTEKIKADLRTASTYFLLALQKGDPRGILGLNRLSSESEITFGKTTTKIARLAKPFSLMGVLNKNEGEILASLSSFYSADPFLKRYFLHAAAQFGHAKSQFEYGKSYSRDETEVLFWMMQAAENNACLVEDHTCEAIGLCGHFFEQGKGTKQDYLKAYSYFKRAAHHPQATSLDYSNFALIHEQGKGVPVDFQIAHFWYKKAYEANPTDGDAKYHYGRITALLGNYSEAIEYIRPTSTLSDEKSYNYACALLKEQGGDKIPSEALEIFKELAEQAHFESLVTIAKYVYEDKIVFDLDKLKQKLAVATKQEDSLEKVSIAYQCLYLLANKGVDCSYFSEFKDVDSLEKAIEINPLNYEAKLLYAKYLKGSGRLKEALVHFQEIHKSKTNIVFNDIGACYDLLSKEEVDLKMSSYMEKKAYKFYLKQLAFSGNEDYQIAAYNIACLHMQERAGLKSNTAETIEYLHIAAEGGDSTALHDLAVAYHRGLWGVERNSEKAKDFYRRAIQKGETTSRSNLALLLLFEGQSEEDYRESKELFRQILFSNDELIYKIFSTIDNIKNQQITENTDDIKSLIVEPIQIEKEIIKKPILFVKTSENKPRRMYDPLKPQNDEEDNEEQRFNKKFDRLKQKLDKFKDRKQVKYRKVKVLMEQFIQLHGGHLKRGKGSGQRIKIGDNFSGFHRPHSADVKKGALKGMTQSMEVTPKKNS